MIEEKKVFQQKYQHEEELCVNKWGKGRSRERKRKKKEEKRKKTVKEDNVELNSPHENMKNTPNYGASLTENTLVTGRKQL